MLDLDQEDLRNLIRLINRSPITGEEALPVVLLRQKLEHALNADMEPIALVPVEKASGG